MVLLYVGVLGDCYSLWIGDGRGGGGDVARFSPFLRGVSCGIGVGGRDGGQNCRVDGGPSTKKGVR